MDAKIPDDIEITPEMIEAAQSVLEEGYLGDSQYLNTDELVGRAISSAIAAMRCDGLSESDFRKLMDDHREESIALARWLLWPEIYSDPREKSVSTLDRVHPA